MKSVRSLVLVAADGGFRLLTNDGIGKGLAEVLSALQSDFPDVDVDFDDKQPRVIRGTGASHAAEPRHTKAELERDRMAGHILAALEKVWAAGSYDRLFVSAPDKMLGVLRKRLPEGLGKHLVADLHKDLLKVPVEDLARHFEDVVVF